MLFFANAHADAWSETIPENFSGPTLKSTSLIFWDKNSAVCASLEKSFKLWIISFLSGVIIIKTYNDWPLRLVQPSNPKKKIILIK